jgi:hypothetical protein
MQKSYNQLWKESGTDLSYKEWRRMYDDQNELNLVTEKIEIPKIPPLKDNPMFQKTMSDLKKASGFKEDVSGKTTFGINKKLLIVASLIIVGAIGYKIYQIKKGK